MYNIYIRDNQYTSYIKYLYVFTWIHIHITINSLINNILYTSIYRGYIIHGLQKFIYAYHATTPTVSVLVDN